MGSAPLNKNHCYVSQVKYIETPKPKQISNSLIDIPLGVHQAIISPLKDRRIRNIIDHIYPFNCILKLAFPIIINGKPSSYQATGFLIAPRVICTAAHFLQKYKSLGQNIKKIKIFDHTLNVPEDLLTLHSIEHQDYHYPESYDSSNQFIQDDYGIIILKEPIKRDKYLTIGLNYKMMNYPCTVCGFPIQKKYSKSSIQLEQLKMTGRVMDIGDGYLEYDNDTTVGQSGSCILIELIKGDYIVIGIHSGYYFQIIQNGKKIKSGLIQSSKRDTFNSACRFTNKTATEITKTIEKFQQRNHLNQSERQKLKFRIVDLDDIKISLPTKYYEPNVLKQKRTPSKSQKKMYTAGTIGPSQISASTNPSSVMPSNISNSRQASSIQTLQKKLDTCLPLNRAKQDFKCERYRESLIKCEQLFIDSSSLALTQQVQLYNLLGLNYQLMNSYDIAQSFFKISLYTLTKIAQYRQQAYAEVCKDLVHMFLELNKLDKAQYILKIAKEKLYKNKSYNNEYYLEIIISIALANNFSVDFVKKNAISLLVQALQILRKMNDSTTTHLDKRILVLKTMFRYLHELKQYSEWANSLLRHFQTIIEIKLEVGLYDKDPKLAKLRNEKTNPNQIQRLQVSQYKLQAFDARNTKKSFTTQTEKNQQKQVVLSVQTNNEAMTNFYEFLLEYEQFSQQLLQQFQEILQTANPNLEKVKFNIALVFQEIFRGTARKAKIDDIRSNIMRFMQTYIKSK